MQTPLKAIAKAQVVEVEDIGEKPMVAQAASNSAQMTGLPGSHQSEPGRLS
jgi:hypothetical protein